MKAPETLKRFAEIRSRQRKSANRAFHARLVSRLGKPAQQNVLKRLREAYDRCGDDFAANRPYMDAFDAAVAAVKADGGIPPIRPREAESVKERVHREVWASYIKSLPCLVRAYDADARLVFITVTCRDDENAPWLKRLGIVTSRRDKVLAAVKRHTAWSACFFDVHMGGSRSDDFSPHWHMLLITSAERLPDFEKRLSPLRSVAMKVKFCDFVRRRPAELVRADHDRRRSWLRTLAYCAKVWRPGALINAEAAKLDPPWRPPLIGMLSEKWLLKRTHGGAVAARAAYVVNEQKFRICKTGLNVRRLPRLLARAAIKVKNPRGRPRKVFDVADLEIVQAGKMSIAALMKKEGSSYKTVKAAVRRLAASRTQVPAAIKPVP